MELDRRILEGKKPLDCFEVSVAKEFIEKECYFSDCLSDFSRLSCFTDFPSEHRRIGTLRLVSETDVSPFYLSDLHSCRYILPCEWVKQEARYRPFTLAEWIERYEIGDIIHYRCKSQKIELRHMYTGYAHGIDVDIKNTTSGTLTLGVASYCLDYLFEDYEICIYGEWQPFGIEE